MLKDCISLSQVNQILTSMRGAYRELRQNASAAAIDEVMLRLKEATPITVDEEERPVLVTGAGTARRVAKVEPFGEGFEIGHMVLRCSHCGGRLRARDVYCGHCGRGLRDE